MVPGLVGIEPLLTIVEHVVAPYTIGARDAADHGLCVDIPAKTVTNSRWGSSSASRTTTRADRPAVEHGDGGVVGSSDGGHADGAAEGLDVHAVCEHHTVCSGSLLVDDKAVHRGALCAKGESGRGAVDTFKVHLEDDTEDACKEGEGLDAEGGRHTDSSGDIREVYRETPCGKKRTHDANKTIAGRSCGLSNCLDDAAGEALGRE